MSAATLPALGVSYVPMRESDLDAVFAAELRIYPFPWSRGNFADSLSAGYSAWMCRMPVDGNALVGYGVLMLVLDEAHLLNLSIVPEYRRQGLGAALLEHLLNVGRAHGAKHVYLEVRRSNSAGIALYLGNGFSAIGERRGYYPADQAREDAIVMVRDL
jgi:ribosomal-protein-alanine N-acetyltransferase